MKLSLKDEIYGCLVGAAIGDALGLGTEYMSRTEVKRRYPEGLRSYDDIARDAHRRQWKRGEWTNDTDMLLMLVDSLEACRGHDAMDYARRLKEWVGGFPTELVNSIRWVLTQPDYLDDPVGVSQRTWEKINQYDASNEALGRALVIGLLPGDREDAIRNAVDNSRLTHYDDRCWGTSAIIAATGHSLMWEDRIPDFEELKEIGLRYNPEIIPYLRTAWEGDLDDIQLDDEATYWYTRKTMAAALHTLWHEENPESILYTLVDAGGDADTNAALGLALAGLRYGIDALPLQHLDTLLGKEKILDAAERLTHVVEGLAK